MFKSDFNWKIKLSGLGANIKIMGRKTICQICMNLQKIQSILFPGRARISASIAT